MAIGLSVSDVVQVNVNLQPLAVATRNFGALCIIGDSSVIDTGTRIRQYANLDGVASDFGTTAPEYLAADLFFAQDPQPSILYLGRWASGATAGQLNGAVFSPTQQTALLATLQGITTGGMTVTVDGTPHVLSNLDFHLITNLNGAATILDTALTSSSDVSFDGALGRFEVRSHTTGASSTVSYAVDPNSGATLATDLGLTAASGASVPVDGLVSETPLAAVTAVALRSADIYGLMFAFGEESGGGGTITEQQYLDVAAYIEGASLSHVFGITMQDPGCIDPTDTGDLGSQLKAANYSRTFWQYSTSSPYAIASAFGRAFTVDFSAQNTVITLKFKQEPGVTAEQLTETQAATLKSKNGNVFVRYMNDTAIIQEGVMANGFFFDERHGCDWLQNNVQTAVYNLLYTSPTKIPQTDSGIHQIVATVEFALDQGVNNGLIAPGVWTSSLEFGRLKRGMTLSKGWYVFAPAVATQNQADREARKAPPIQCGIKLAGAVHSANVAINVNR